jgi:deoxyribonuclease-4
MSKELILGWHTSISPSIIKGIECNKKTHKNNDSIFNISAQIFLKSPMKVSCCKFVESDYNKTREFIEEHNIYLIVHGQYIINFIKKDVEWAIKSVVDDIIILDKMTPELKKEQTGVIIHMGKNVNKYSIEECIENFYINVKQVIDKTSDCKTKLILETSTKTKNGNDIFHDIEIFGQLVNYLKTNLSLDEYNRVGYCIDTAHIFASGYDISTKESFKDFMSLWDKHIGINKLTLFHLNDSKVGLGCCRDLHEQIGSGLIYTESKEGLNALIKFAKDNMVPVIIESGGDQDIELKIIQTLNECE